MKTRQITNMHSEWSHVDLEVWKVDFHKKVILSPTAAHHKTSKRSKRPSDSIKRSNTGYHAALVIGSQHNKYQLHMTLRNTSKPMCSERKDYKVSYALTLESNFPGLTQEWRLPAGKCSVPSVPWSALHPRPTWAVWSSPTPQSFSRWEQVALSPLLTNILPMTNPNIGINIMLWGHIQYMRSLPSAMLFCEPQGPMGSLDPGSGHSFENKGHGSKIFANRISTVITALFPPKFV